MLRDGHVYAKPPTSDPARARRFYVETLGFEPTSEWSGHMRFDCADGSTFVVFPSSGTASGDHDQCGWLVDDIEAEVAELRRHGITFEEFPGETYVDGIRDDPAGRSAWFRDSEGEPPECAEHQAAPTHSLTGPCHGDDANNERIQWQRRAMD